MLIEDEETERHSDVNPSKPSSSTNKDASDGFETASDGELGPNGSDNDDETQQQHQVQEEQQSLSQTDDLKQVFVFAKLLFFWFLLKMCCAMPVYLVDVTDNPMALYESTAYCYFGAQ